MARGRKKQKKRSSGRGMLKPKITTMHDLFEHELEDIYFAEQQLVKALAKLEKEAENLELKDALRAHREETENHVRRLDEIFQSFGKKAKAKRCDGILGLIKENDAFLKLRPVKELKDLILMGSASKAEHYEISAYESLIGLAQKHGMNDAVPFLEDNLREEQAALEKVKGIMEAFDASSVQAGMEEQMELATTS